MNYENQIKESGFDFHNLLSLIPYKCCTLNVRLIAWHYFAKPIIQSSWLLLLITMIGLYMCEFLEKFMSLSLYIVQYFTDCLSFKKTIINLELISDALIVYLLICMNH